MYSAPNEETARGALEEFAASELGARYPQTAPTWQRFTPFLAFPPMARRVVYTTNANESLNYQLRKITKNRGHFPSEEAAVKLLWPGICNIKDKRATQRLTDAGNPPPTNEQPPHASPKDTPPPTGNKPSPNSPPPTSNPHTQKN